MKFILESRLLAVSFCFVLGGNLHAISRTWDGGGGIDPRFSNALNWDDNATIPTSGVDPLQVGANTVGPPPVIAFNTGIFQTPSFTFLATATAAYTVTAAASGSDFLTLTGSGVALLNSSPVRQTFELMTTNVSAATQTWNGGAQGLVTAQIDLGADHVLTFDGTGNAAATRNVISGKITGTATSGVTKIGTGFLLLNASEESDYTGATTLSNGRLQLGSANQIPNSSKLILNAGTTFDTGGFGDTIGALKLGGASTIDFGSTAPAVALSFSASNLESWSAGTLAITNFTAGVDTLRFGSTASGLMQSQLNQITLNGMPVGITGMGYLFAIPEPGVSATILSGLAILGLTRRHRSRRATA